MFTCDTCFNPTNPFILLFYLTIYTILRVATTFIPNVLGVDLALVNYSPQSFQTKKTPGVMAPP
ncbi:hypothetical protein PISMIDRAFT_683228 [Pisolithus microcarpus 441]|uniref:Uncharacterized protein n=1 Tax=Pisolithus microcarpus 441 TaxID=765257 RepID=A0A0C9ZA65_9AGAM|nr:hypothetical protein PISMIDRAFT_683228 [Pisolithus microcarpus 441]